MVTFRLGRNSFVIISKTMAFVKKNLSFFGNNIFEVFCVRIWKQILYSYLGGMAYTGLELLWRGRTHGSMFALGGLCFLGLGQLRRLQLPLPLRGLAGSVLVTSGELAAGLLVNSGYRIWDYRSLPLNFRGQICLRFSLLWIPVSLAAMVLYSFLDRKISLFLRQNRHIC